MAMGTRDISSIGFLMKCLFSWLQYEKSRRFIFEKVRHCKNPMCKPLVLAYQAIFSSGAHNSINFLPIWTKSLSHLPRIGGYLDNFYVCEPIWCLLCIWNHGVTGKHVTRQLITKIHLFTWYKEDFSNFLEKWSSPIFESMATCCNCVQISSQPHME